MKIKKNSKISFKILSNFKENRFLVFKEVAFQRQMDSIKEISSIWKLTEVHVYATLR